MYVLMHGSIRWYLAVSHVWWTAGVVLWTQGSTLHALAHRRAEGGRVLGGMMLRRRRMRECKRELMCRRRAQNDAPEGCACGTASNFDRADGSGCGASGASMEAAAARRTAAATGWESRWSRSRDRLAATKAWVAPPLEAQGCAFCETGVCVVKGTASPRDWVYIEYSFLIRLLRAFF